MIHGLRFLGEAGTTAAPKGVRLAAPESSEACSRTLKGATDRGWRARPVGRREWGPGEGAGELFISTSRLTDITDIRAADLVVTVGAGVTISDLSDALAPHGVWFPVDPPGERRTMGSILATGTSGALRGGFGPVRDHVLGLTFVTGDGRIVRAGGRVVKNVAGFDLTRLVVGSFGAFGMITEAHLRLRARPQSDVSLVGSGSWGEVLASARAILATGVQLGALEIYHPAPGDHCTLGVRVMGSEAAASNAVDVCTQAASVSLAPGGEIFWQDTARAMSDGPVTMRAGMTLGTLEPVLSAFQSGLGKGRITATLGAAPALRWSGDADAAAIDGLRRVLADMDAPIIVERAPDSVLNRTGHFGHYRPGVRDMVNAIRRAFDPADTLAIPLHVD